MTSGLGPGEVFLNWAPLFLQFLAGGWEKRPGRLPPVLSPGELSNAPLRGETKQGRDPDPGSSRKHGAKCPGACVPLPTPHSWLGEGPLGFTMVSPLRT